MSMPKTSSALRSIGSPAAYPVFVVRYQAFQQKVGRTGCVPRRWCGPGGARHLQHTTAEGQATGQDRGRKCLQVGRPGKVGIDWFEPARGLQ